MTKENIKELSLLKDQMGSEITLLDEEDNEHVFHLLLELSTNDKHYAYFQMPDTEDGDIEVLQVTKDDNEELDLEFIEDDDEWEKAAELFDEWTYSEED